MTTGMTPKELANFGQAMLAGAGLATAPPPFQARLPSGVERDRPAAQPGVTTFAGTDGDLAGAVASAHAATLRAKPVAEPQPGPDAERAPTPAEERAALRAEIDAAAARVDQIAKNHGIDLTGRARVPSPEQQRADERSKLLARAVVAAEEQRSLKARRRAAKALRKLGL